jgi:glycosyltransferase involved in cell wall biosynthesis
MDPKFSILVPTRQRPDTLLATLATLIWQSGDDYEIVIADNCGDQEVAAVIAAAQQQHSRIKHIRSDQVLPMSDNWERGLAACSGEYVSVLGDDDGFLPSTLDIVRQIVAVSDARVIAWDFHVYWWPDTVVHWNRNRLNVTLGNNDMRWLDSRSTLVTAYRNPTGFSHLPTIYNGFVHREIINSVIDRFGAYFVPRGLSPDVTSGVANLVHTSRYLCSFRPLAVRGNSRRSTGSSFFARSLGKEQQETYLKEERKTIEQLMHPSMTASKNLNFGIASLKLFIKDLMFPHDRELQVDLATAVRQVIADLNSDPDAYDDNLTEALRLAEKIGLKVDRGTIPAKASIIRNRLQGPQISDKTVTIGINCDLAKVFDVAGAARLAEALSSPITVSAAQPTGTTKALEKAG